MQCRLALMTVASPPPPKQDQAGDRAMRWKVNPPFHDAWLSVRMGRASGHVFTRLIRGVQRRIQPSRPSRVATSLHGMHHTMSSSIKGREGGQDPRLHCAKEVLLRSWAAATTVVLGRRGDEEGSAPQGLNVPRRQCDKPIVQLSGARPLSPLSQVESVQSSPLSQAHQVEHACRARQVERAHQAHRAIEPIDPSSMLTYQAREWRRAQPK